MQPAWMVPGLLAVVLVAAWLTAMARGYALRRQLLDQPGERRSHAVATPRGGGIAIVASQLLACLCIGVLFPAAAATLAVFSAGLLLVAGIGWWDDHRPLPALPRLAVHVLAGLLLAGLVWHWTGDAFRAASSALLAIGLINVWNFMDGIDGLAATQALLAALAYALLLPTPVAALALVLVAGVAGFLPFNFPRARIFMGDVGSGALGYLLAGLVALGLATRSAPLAVLLIPLSAFLVDAGLTLAGRILRGERWMEPHTQHLYQRWVKSGHSHVTVTLGYALFGVAGIALTLVSHRLSSPWNQLAAMAWGAVAAGLWFALRNTSNNREG
ncbi:MAG TPA: lipopolysaccharide biosynthesis protein [Delftia acidovorans]|jgi:UDP-N-acetylmuramyl pentapeptide phosphotransferase/UDP-N-acetylglucosamine-1-phosphate transferase|uniref:lipopolysaccharide biosynthesis protein n=1 Tax=Stenotrophomonas TaxID=40323 RepID=UPI000703AA40|nr:MULTISPECIES: lipopolysaccharide biosynthesis protein [Stenotrophomonas]KRG85384.1 lipopolysaccharide biosynthesis protein [Stenotrophomonas acidaminiphila]QOF97139.1 lipopolysaccharide biosynthesis protein [Stenotrophomonas sp. CW117]HBK00988.1 lipopolysaccharide biosynthesis protein [Delftia acidovorans]